MTEELQPAQPAEEGTPMVETMNGSEVCYRVEARLSPTLPTEPLITGVVDDVERPFVLSTDWRHVPMRMDPWGVPNRLYDPFPARSGYQTYEAAMALAYWFLSICDRSSINVRLVRYRHEYTHAIARLADGPLLTHGFDADRATWMVPIEPSAPQDGRVVTEP